MAEDSAFAGLIIQLNRPVARFVNHEIELYIIKHIHPAERQI